MDFKSVKKGAHKVWNFIWESDSPWSWLVNIILAFVIIKFLVYPALGLLLGTSYPIVAVVSGSMEHKTVNPCLEKDVRSYCIKYNENIFELCGKTFSSNQKIDLFTYWSSCGDWYEKNRQITMQAFNQYPMKNGFNTGDIIILKGAKPENIKTGAIIVYMSPVKPDPIIHRVVETKNDQTGYYFKTKGDHNEQSFFFEQNIPSDTILGEAWIRIPYLGYVKIWFVRLLEITGIIDLVQFVRGVK